MTHTATSLLATMAAAVASVSLLTAGARRTGRRPGQAHPRRRQPSARRPEEAYDAFDEQVTQFEAANPDIDIVAHEYKWTGPTFTAALAGGTLPDVFTIPFTDGKTLIENGQLADITDRVNALPLRRQVQPERARRRPGRGRQDLRPPAPAYGIGLHYNRDLFTQAGLDPDKPPTTWDEVRADAKTIADKTGQAGYVQMSQSNTGGWQSTVATYARGGRMESVAADGTVTSTVNNPGTKAALQFLQGPALGRQLHGLQLPVRLGHHQPGVRSRPDRHVHQGSDVYTALVQANQIDPEIYGLTTIPLPMTRTRACSAAATSRRSTSSPRPRSRRPPSSGSTSTTCRSCWTRPPRSPTPRRSPRRPARRHPGPADLRQGHATTQSQEWIKDYINVPLDQMTGFTDGIFDQPLVPEPSHHTQEIYAILDTVVQAVLTDENADIDALLTDAQSQVQALIDADAAASPAP